MGFKPIAILELQDSSPNVIFYLLARPVNVYAVNLRHSYVRHRIPSATKKRSLCRFAL